MEITIYHNPKCSKSRQALALLNERFKDIKVIEYLKHLLNYKQLDTLLQLLKLEAIQIMRTKEPEFKKLKLTTTSPKKNLIEAMVKFPILMERPVVVVGKKAFIARPPERILEVL